MTTLSMATKIRHQPVVGNSLQSPLPIFSTNPIFSPETEEDLTFHE
jgi:hypothetical protein